MSFLEMQEIVSIMLDQIMQLKQQNETTTQQLQEMTTLFQALVGQQETFLQDYNSTKENIATSLRIQDYGLTNLKYELADPTVEQSAFLSTHSSN